MRYLATKLRKCIHFIYHGLEDKNEKTLKIELTPNRKCTKKGKYKQNKPFL